MTNKSTSPRHRLRRQSIVRLLSCLGMLMLWTQGLRAADEVTIQRLGGFDTAGYATDVQVVSNLAYVADHFAGIQVLEVTDPANIQPLGGFYTGDYALEVRVDGHRAYVASRDAGLRVLDVSDPTNIVHLGTFGTRDYAVNVQTAGSIAYLVDDDNGLLVLDVSDPGQIGQLGSYYPGIDTRAVHVVGNLAYLAIDSGLLILEVSSPANMWPLGGYDTSGAQDVEVVRNIAYVASGGNGLQVLDVSNPDNIQRLGGYPASEYANDVVVQGHLAFVTDDTSGLQIFEVSDPANIRRLGGYDTVNQALSVQVVGNRLYLADGAGLQVLQMSGLPVSRPRVVLEPADQFAHLGEAASFQVVAAGDEPLAYRWRKDGQALLDGDRITGTTTPRLTIQTLEPADRGLCSAIVSNSYGSVTSAVASLTLNLASVDAEFDPWANYGVNSIVVQTDGRIVVGGSFTSLAGQPRNRIARLNADGTLDPIFNPGAEGEQSPSVHTLAIQPDGTILVGGRFTTLGGQPRLNLARLNADGTIDTGFDPGVQGGHVYWTFVNALVPQADGKILVGGVFTNLAGKPRQNIGRLNSDGTLDESFDPGANNWVLAIALQPDGRILVGGGFTMLGSQPRNFLGRLKADGTLDSGFSPEADDWVSSLAVQADGKILVGISQTSAPDLDIARLNADGSLDITFHRTPIDDPGDDGVVNTLALQADGKVLVGGEFTLSDGPPRNNLGRLNADGTLDPDFNPEVHYVVSLAVQPDGKILVGGEFTTLGGQPRTNLARLNNTAPATQSLSYDGSNVIWLRGGTSPEVWRTTLDYSTEAVTWASVGSGTRIPGGWQWTEEVAVPTNALLRARGFVAGSGISEWFVESLLATFPQTAPAIVTGDGSLGVSSNRFGFNISGVAGQVVVIEGSSNLVHWTSLDTNRLSNGPFYFSDPTWSGLPTRFYRVRLWP